ncbi:MAG: hypothetical protein JSU95_07015 [Betaproteobacteria bacterium]|nr:MAG: hypothetical protein JSU95_07015 [Betaproteobacteria bacterium]
MKSGIKRSLAAVTFAAIASFGMGSALACVEGDIRGDVVIAEHDAGATPAGETATFHLLGAGWLRSVVVTKLGGDDDRTYVTLEADGKDVFSTSFANLKNPMMQLNTPYIVANVKTTGNIDKLTLWYSPEVKFRGMLLVRVTVKEEGVEGVRMRMTMNKPAPHEHVAGQPAGILATLPAFK